MERNIGSLFDSITVYQRILLHLLGYFNARDAYTQPLEVTQEGISAAVGARRSHVSYCMKELRERGLTDESLKSIRKKRRRRKAYFLTTSGLEKGRELKGRVLKQTVVMRYEGDEEGSESAVSALLKDNRRITPVDVVRQVRDKGWVEIPSDAEPSDGKAETAEENVFYAKDVSECPYFTGRERELKLLSDWSNRKDAAVFAVCGIAGIGKTSLGYRFARKAREDFNVFWYGCEEWTADRSVLTSLADFWARTGNEEMSSYIQNTMEPDVSRILSILKDRIGQNRVMFFFDDVHKLKALRLDLLRALVNLALGTEGSKIVLMSRELPKLYHQRDVLVEGAVTEHRLEGLDVEECSALLERWDTDHEGPSFCEEELYDLTRGHPLALELAKGRKLRENISRDITRFFREEILKDLSVEEERMLEAAAIYRSTIPSGGLFLEDGDHRTLDSLLDQTLLKETFDGYIIHDVLREVIMGRLVPRRERRLRELVAEYLRYEARTGRTNLATECFHHYIRIGKRKRAAEVVLEFGVELSGSGYMRDVLGFLDDLLETGDGGPDMGEDPISELKCLKGNLLTFTGRLEEAEELLNDIAGKADTRRVLKVRMKARNGLGIISYKRGEYQRAIEQYDRSLALAERSGDKTYMCKVLSNLGVLHGETGDTERAEKAHREALELCRESGDREGQARAYNNLGILSFHRDRYTEAIDMFKRGLEISRELGNMQIAAIALNNLGDAYGRKGDGARSEKYYRKGLGISEKYNFERQREEALSGLSKLGEGG